MPEDLDWWRVVTTALPLVLGLLTIFLLPALRLSRTLRRDLELDASYVDKLPRGAQGELRRDMAERAWIVVAFSRHPSATRIELLAALVVMTVSALSTSFIIGTVRDGFALPDVGAGASVMLAVQAGVFGVAVKRWRARASARLTHLRKRLHADAYGEFVRSTALFYRLLRIGIIVLAIGPAALNVATLLIYPPATSLADLVNAVPGVGIFFIFGTPAVLWIFTVLSDSDFDEQLAEGGELLGTVSVAGRGDVRPGAQMGRPRRSPKREQREDATEGGPGASGVRP